MSAGREIVTGAIWRKSSHSNPSGGDCVEVALPAGESVPVRDSKAPARAVLVFPASAWTAFLGGLEQGTVGQA